MNFKGKTVIVTGGARGLGLAYVTAFAKRGANVVISDAGCDNLGNKTLNLSPQESIAHNVAKKLTEAHNYNVIAFSQFLNDEASCQKLVNFTVENFGTLDIVIHNAGWVGYEKIEATTLAFMERAMNTALYVPTWICKHAWRYLLIASTPRIVLTTSDRAMYIAYRQEGLIAYAASKMAQIGLMNALSAEGAKAGIQINAISPIAKTRMWGIQDTPENLKPEWVTPGVLFLASDACQDSGYILRASNGQFTATRFEENPDVIYPYDLARICATSPEEIAQKWALIKEQ